MPLEDRDIFLAICERFSDQPMEFIMEQYEKAKRINIDIEKRIGAAAGAPQPVEQPVQEIVEEAAAVVQEPPKKKYTKRNLKIKPQDAIGDEFIKCCICGLERKTLTATHLNGHDISVEEYKKLCGYDPKLPLMSRNKLAKARDIIARAQKARLDRRASMRDD